MKLYFDNGRVKLYQGDARNLSELPDNYFHCIVTSPPYYGLRLYGAGDAEIGAEPDMADYIGNMLAVSAECFRVLRPDGVFWFNIADSYNGSGGAGGDYSTGGLREGQPKYPGRNVAGLKPKDLLGIPWRLAFAFQEQGWYLRSDNIWAKKSWMPYSGKGWQWTQHRIPVEKSKRAQSGHHSEAYGSKPLNERDPENPKAFANNDARFIDCPGCPKCLPNDGLVLRRGGAGRTTPSKEYIFMFTKTGEHYYDTLGAAEEALYDGRKDTKMKGSAKYADGYSPANPQSPPAEDPIGHERSPLMSDGVKLRNRRDVWLDISPSPFKGNHFAAFPKDLARICIQASTSEAGVCPHCGAPWARVVDRISPGEPSQSGRTHNTEEQRMGKTPVPETGWESITKTLGWRPTCECPEHKPIPATVLDPFGGSGTTAAVAQSLGRNAVHVELSEQYLDIPLERLGANEMAEWVNGVQDESSFEIVSEDDLSDMEGQTRMFK